MAGKKWRESKTMTEKEFRRIERRVGNEKTVRREETNKQNPNMKKASTGIFYFISTKNRVHDFLLIRTLNLHNQTSSILFSSTENI